MPKTTFLADAREDVHRAQKRLALLRQSSRSINEALQFVTKLSKPSRRPRNPFNTPKIRVTHWLDTNTYRSEVILHVDTNIQVTSIKDDAELQRVLQNAEEFFDFQESRDYATERYGRRTFAYAGCLNGITLYWEIDAVVANDSLTCVKVKVGEEMTVVPKYEIRCN